MISLQIALLVVTAALAVAIVVLAIVIMDNHELRRELEDDAW